MKQYLARWVATCSWLGLSPFAPGTVASVHAGAAFGMLRLMGGGITMLACWTLLFFIGGLWASHRVSFEMGQADPACIVIDEWVGVWALLLFVPFSLWYYIAAIILFRFFDITKVWPVSWAEKARGAWGIMFDDLVAALYAGLVLLVAKLFFL